MKFKKKNPEGMLFERWPVDRDLAEFAGSGSVKILEAP